MIQRPCVFKRKNDGLLIDKLRSQALHDILAKEIHSRIWNKNDANIIRTPHWAMRSLRADRIPRNEPTWLCSGQALWLSLLLSRVIYFLVSTVSCHHPLFPWIESKLNSFIIIYISCFFRFILYISYKAYYLAILYMAYLCEPAWVYEKNSVESDS